MKHLYYVANYRMPTERAHGLQVAKMCEAFAKAGVHVTLIAPARGKRRDIFSYYEIAPNFFVEYLPTWDLTGKIPVIGFLIQSITFARSVVQYVRRKKYAGSIYSRDQIALAVLSRRVPNRLYYEVHSMPKRVRAAHRSMFKKMSGFIAISRGVCDDLQKAGVQSQRITIAHDGYDPSIRADTNTRASILHEWKISQDARVVLYAGSFIKWKGIYILIEAARVLPSGYAVVLIGGTENELRRIQNETAEMPRNVTLVKQMSQRALIERSSAADILVIPNSGSERISSVYTSPMKLFWYLATGKPIVASDVPALRKIADRYDGVYFCPPDDSSALAVAIQKAATGPRIFHRDVSSYSWDARARKILDAIGVSTS